MLVAVTALLAQAQVPTPPPPEEPSSGLAWWAYLIWAWAIVSLSVYAYRLIRRFTGHKPDRSGRTADKAATDASGTTSTTGSTGTSPTTGTTSTTPPAPTTAARGPSPSNRAGEQSTGSRLGATLRKAAERPPTVLPEPPSGPSPTEALFLEAKAARARGEDPDAAVAATASSTGGAEDGAGGSSPSDRRGLFAAAPDDGPPRRPVAELVRGIELPCELVPVVEGADPDGHQVTFHTRIQDPARVGRELGDALEAIGYALRSTSDTEVVATRDADELRVRIVPRAGDARDDGRARYPTLPPADVVVELES
ncbi:MAG: hypothetical protein U0Q07_01735 [Acidimicrobiales bacterium]